MGETAPLLFTSAFALGLTFGLGSQMNSLPVQIFNDITSPKTSVNDRAWGAGLVLVLLVLIFNLIARLAGRRSRGR